ncbi:MAG: 3-dehydroquinate synthase [Rhodospirillaceae bacterium]|nr:3-dehydroquinate synthase [Rhodospirillaceae bacterium]
MTESTLLTVALQDRSYPIDIGAGLIEQAGKILAPLIQKPRVYIVTDENVAEHHLAPLQDSLQTSNIDSDYLILPPGESTKSFANLQVVVESMLSAKVERSTTVIALGGGVVGDLAGFAASVTLRGIDFVQIPTTLLAQVDSSVGGKTGINTGQGKNLAGSFYQPKAVLVDTDTLATLPDRERLAGYAEVCKYGLLGDLKLWEWLEKNGEKILSGDDKAITHAIEASCRAKARIVAEDERESGVRALLNLGHTFAHAFEAELGYSGALLHGEAVAFGMLMAFDLSVRLGLCPASDIDRVRTHFETVGLPVNPPELARNFTADVFLKHMAQDKKVADGALTFVLLHGIGQAFLTQNVSPRDVTATLNAALTA